MDRNWAKEWLEKIKSERSDMEKKVSDLGKEIGKLNLKIAMLDRVEAKEWPKPEEFDDAMLLDVLTKCSDERKRLKDERKEKNNARANLYVEIELGERIIETLKREYRLEKEN